MILRGGEKAVEGMARHDPTIHDFSWGEKTMEDDPWVAPTGDDFEMG
jgi:hypothetical protein